MIVRGFSLPRDIPLLLRLPAELLWLEWRIRHEPLPDIVADIRRSQAKSPAIQEQAALAVMDKLWRGCGFWLRRLQEPERPCLRRSLVLFRWRIHHGLPVRLLIGVDRQPGCLAGHAWIATPQGPYREDAGQLARYTVMLEYEG